MFGVRLEGLQHSYLPVSKSFKDSEIFQLWRQLPTFGFGKHHTFNKHPDKKTIMHLDSEGIMDEVVVMNRGIGEVPIDNEPEKLNDELVRVEICRDRRDWRSCKICASCVNFPGKQYDFSQNLRRITRFTHQV